MSTSTPRRKPSWLWKVLVTLAGGILGLVIGPLLFLAYMRLPQGSWQELPSPPERIAHLVTSTPIGLWGGEVYATTADGALYAWVCEWGKCTWASRDTLPPPPDPEDYWSGPCPDGSDKPDEKSHQPRLPGRVAERYATRYCGPDYSLDVFYLLLDDSSLWSWERMNGGHGMAVGIYLSALVGAACGLVIGLVVALVVLRRPR